MEVLVPLETQSLGLGLGLGLDKKVLFTSLEKRHHSRMRQWL